VDHYRPSYGIRSQDFPRQCVFIGSTNSDAYPGDETGGRRFWPLKVGRIDIDALRRDVGQFWAEAVVAFNAGERWWLDHELERAARDEQEQRRVDDPWEQRILQWAGGRAEVTVADALDQAIRMPLDRQGQADRNRVARILVANGWLRTQVRRNGSRAWFYIRSAPADTSDTLAHADDTPRKGNGADSGLKSGGATGDTPYW
jgi:predicted P-loop ATPase